MPYGIIIHIHDLNVDDYDRKMVPEDISLFELDRIGIKPYLRSMSSMTKEEYEEYSNLEEYNYIQTVDFLLSNHFDFRGLIERKLAIEVTKENNPYENEL